MKREFLQNLKVGEAFLPKEVIDAIMEENGRDINAAKAAAVKPFADYETIVAENDRLKAGYQELTVDGMTAMQWKETYDRAVQAHQTQLDGVAFQNILENTITRLGGRSVKAISALLELDTLQQSKDRQTAVEEALKSLKAESGYLFADQTPPPYARGTGTQNNPTQNAPTNLAGALREKFERK